MLNPQEQIDSYTRTINDPDASAEQIAKALNNRGISYGQRNQTGDWDLKVADYTAVIEMTEAPAEQVARALYNRGFSYGQRNQTGDWELEVADYTAVIEMTEAPAELVARARFSRGQQYALARMYQACLSDCEMAYANTAILGFDLMRLAHLIKQLGVDSLKGNDEPVSPSLIAMEGVGKTVDWSEIPLVLLIETSKFIQIPLFLHRSIEARIASAQAGLKSMTSVATAQQHLDVSTAAARRWLLALEADGTRTGLSREDRRCWQMRIRLACGDPVAVRDDRLDLVKLVSAGPPSATDIWMACLWIESLWVLRQDDRADRALDTLRPVLEQFAERSPDDHHGAFLAAGVLCWEASWDGLAKRFADRAGDTLAATYLRWAISDAENADDEPQRFLEVLLKEKQLQETARWGYLFHALADEDHRGVNTAEQRAVLDRWLNLNAVELIVTEFAENERLDPIGMTPSERKAWQEQNVASEETDDARQAGVHAEIHRVVAEMNRVVDRDGWSVGEALDRELKSRHVAKKAANDVIALEQKISAAKLAAVRARFRDSVRILVGDVDERGCPLIKTLARTIRALPLISQRVRVYDVLNLLICEDRLKPNDWLMLTLYAEVKRRYERENANPSQGGRQVIAMGAEGSGYVLGVPGGAGLLAAMVDWAAHSVVGRSLDAAAEWWGLRPKQPEGFPDFEVFCRELEKHWTSRFSAIEHSEQCVRNLKDWMGCPPI